MATTKVRVDVWELRCRFNRSGYLEDVASGRLTKIRNRRNPSVHGPLNTFQEQWYINDPVSGDELARVSMFVNPDDSPASPPDPKFLRLHGINYHLRTGGPSANDPAARWPHTNWKRKLYVFWRKRIKCPLLGR
jgi:hypothetical protein